MCTIIVNLWFEVGAKKSSVCFFFVDGFCILYFCVCALCSYMRTWCISICICHQIECSEIVAHLDKYTYVSRGLLLIRQYLFWFECEMAVELYFCICNKRKRRRTRRKNSAQPVEICHRKKLHLFWAPLFALRFISYSIFRLMHCVVILIYLVVIVGAIDVSLQIDFHLTEMNYFFQHLNSIGVFMLLWLGIQYTPYSNVRVWAWVSERTKSINNTFHKVHSRCYPLNSGHCTAFPFDWFIRWLTLFHLMPKGVKENSSDCKWICFHWKII